MRKIQVLLAVITLSTQLHAFGLFQPDLNEQVNYNSKQIKLYEEAITELKKRNALLQKEKSEHPELYVTKPLFEEKKDLYIQRIKLNGAKTDALNFVIKDNTISISMNIKIEQKDEGNYFYSSRYFSTSYGIPKDVNQEKITHTVEGDYFTIYLPKKK